MSKLEVLRWLLVIPASAAGFYLALFIMVLVRTFVDSLCPEQYVYAGDEEYCIYPSWASTLINAFGGSLAAYMVVFLGAITAPAYKRIVPYAIFSAGAIIAVYMISYMGESMIDYLILGLFTLGSGILTAVSLSNRYGA